MKFCPELTVYSLLIYPSRSDTNASRKARQFVRVRIKQDHNKVIERSIEKLHDDLERFAREWGTDTIAVPVPRHAPTVEDAVWPSLITATVLLTNGFVSDVMTLVERTVRVRQSSRSSSAEERLEPIDHVNSMRIIPPLVPPTNVLLVDDLVTRGSTLIGTASLILDAYPDCRIRAFAIARTVTGHNMESIKEMPSPKREKVTYRNGILIRR